MLLLTVAIVLALLPLKALTSTVVVSKFADGIVVGADSLSVSGPMINNRVTRRVFPLAGTDAVVCCCTSATGHADFHHLLVDLRRHVKSSSDVGGGRCKVGASALARFARRLVSQKYRKAHLIIAGVDWAVPGVASISHGSATLLGNRMGPSPKDVGIGEEQSPYSIHEVVAGGTHIVHQEYVVAGSGAEVVCALLQNLIHAGAGGARSSSADVQAKIVETALRSAAAMDPRTGAGVPLAPYQIFLSPLFLQNARVAVNLSHPLYAFLIPQNCACGSFVLAKGYIGYVHEGWVRAARCLRCAAFRLKYVKKSSRQLEGRTRQGTTTSHRRPALAAAAAAAPSGCFPPQRWS